MFHYYFSGCTFQSFESHVSILPANNCTSSEFPLAVAFLITLWSLYDGFMFIITWVRDRWKQKQQTTVEEESNPNVDEECNPDVDEESNPDVDEESNPNVDEESNPNTDEESNPNTDEESNPNTDS